MFVSINYKWIESLEVYVIKYTISEILHQNTFAIIVKYRVLYRR